MKTIKIIFICILFSLSSQVFAQNSELKLLTINIYESVDQGYSKIIVTENEKKIEEIQLLKFYYKDLETNQITINKLLLKYRIAGYKLTSETRGSIPLTTAFGTPSVLITTYLLEKE